MTKIEKSIPSIIQNNKKLDAIVGVHVDITTYHYHNDRGKVLLLGDLYLFYPESKLVSFEIKSKRDFTLAITLQKEFMKGKEF